MIKALRTLCCFGAVNGGCCTFGGHENGDGALDHVG